MRELPFALLGGEVFVQVCSCKHSVWNDVARTCSCFMMWFDSLNLPADVQGSTIWLAFFEVIADLRDVRNASFLCKPPFYQLELIAMACLEVR